MLLRRVTAEWGPTKGRQYYLGMWERGETELNIRTHVRWENPTASRAFEQSIYFCCKRVIQTTSSRVMEKTLQVHHPQLEDEDVTVSCTALNTKGLKFSLAGSSAGWSLVLTILTYPWWERALCIWELLGLPKTCELLTSCILMSLPSMLCLSRPVPRWTFSDAAVFELPLLL